MIRALDAVVLLRDLPDAGLRAGDVGAVVQVHGDGAAYEVEFVTLTGDTVAVTTLRPGDVRPAASREMPWVEVRA